MGSINIFFPFCPATLSKYSRNRDRTTVDIFCGSPVRVLIVVLCTFVFKLTIYSSETPCNVYEVIPLCAFFSSLSDILHILKFNDNNPLFVESLKGPGFSTSLPGGPEGSPIFTSSRFCKFAVLIFNDKVSSPIIGINSANPVPSKILMSMVRVGENRLS